MFYDRLKYQAISFDTVIENPSYDTGEIDIIINGNLANTPELLIASANELKASRVRPIRRYRGGRSNSQRAISTAA